MEKTGYFACMELKKEYGDDAYSAYTALCVEKKDPTGNSITIDEIKSKIEEIRKDRESSSQKKADSLHKISVDQEWSDLASDWVLRIRILRMDPNSKDEAKQTFLKFKKLLDQFGRITLDPNTLKQVEDLEETYRKEEESEKEKSALPPFNKDEWFKILKEKGIEAADEYKETHGPIPPEKPKDLEKQ